MTLSGTFPWTVTLTWAVGVLSWPWHLVAAVIPGMSVRSFVSRYKGYRITTAHLSVAPSSISTMWKGPFFRAIKASRFFGVMVQLPLFSSLRTMWCEPKAEFTAITAS